MVRHASENLRRFTFAYCNCKVDQPFRGKQIGKHRKDFPNHDMSERFRACLGCLKAMEPGKHPDDKISQFLEEHKTHETGTVNSKKSRQFFAALGTTHYLRKRQFSTLEEDEEDEDEDGIEEGEGEGEEIAEDTLVDETEKAVRGIQEADFIHETPPAGFEIIQPGDTQWHSYDQTMRDLFGENTPRAESPTSLPPSPLPPSDDLADFVIPRAPVIKNDRKEVNKSVSVSEDSVFPIGSSDWALHDRKTLIDRIHDRDANQKSLIEKLTKEKEKNKRLKSQLEVLTAREAVLNSTELVLKEAQEKFEKEKRILTDEVAVFQQERNDLEKEKIGIAHQKDSLHIRDRQLTEVANQLKEYKKRTKENARLLLHIPCDSKGITADPSLDECLVNSGSSCGHLQLKMTSGGIVVESWYNGIYSKRLPSNDLYQVPATRPKKS